MNSDSSYVYHAKIGPFGEVIFWRDPSSGAYRFTFFNGEDYTPLDLSPQAAYYVWAFIGCEHPDASINFQSSTQARSPKKKTPTAIKKAGGKRSTKKRPSLAKKSK